nr:attacin 3 [Lasioderma serricorne]
MKSFVVLVLCLASALAFPYENVEDDNEYYLIPTRVRRQLDISGGKSGTRITAGHGGTLYQNDRHQVDGSAFASQNFRHFKPDGPLTTGGRVDYLHKPSGSSASVGASNTRGFGTDLSAQGNLNLYRSQNGRTTLDANARYDRHFGGPFGTGRPNYGGGLNFNHRF